MPDPRTSPPDHLTGGAVDLSIVDCRGRLLDMGTDFDAMVAASQSDYFESMPCNDARTTASRDNRRVLYQAMTDAGFVNPVAFRLRRSALGMAQRRATRHLRRHRDRFSLAHQP